MELIYLWVEDYKNIHKQEFSFSPRFKCEYDEESKELEIIDKEKICEPYLKNFFGDNINTTAIVGENGSGKSRVLECIEKIILADSDEDVDDFKYILVYQNQVPLYISNIDITTSTERTKTFDDICSLVYRFNILDEEKHQAHYYSSANLHYITLEKQGIINILSVKQGDMKTFHISSFMYLPEKVEISVKPYEQLIQEHSSSYNIKKEGEIRKALNKITDPYDQYLSILYIRQKGLDVDADELRNRETLLKSTKDYLSMNDFRTFFITVLNMKKYEISNLSQGQRNIYFHKDYWHYFDFDFIDEKERRFNHLSHGEKVIYSQLLNIFFYINDKNNNKILFLFDEPEISLHPNWQKQYLNEVINLLKEIPKKYHFLFATHSPFLLSDLSKENIIFLEQDKQTGNSINTTNDIDINPFGANIHTLLSHGFFMKKGLMGEFSKGKINKIIENLNDKEYNPLKEDKEILLATINIIGENFLKMKLLDMYYRKFNDEYTKVERKKELLIQKNKIENELKNL